MELTSEQRARLAGTLEAYRELRDRIPEDTENDCEWHRRNRYQAMLIMAGHVLGILGIDAAELV